MHIQTFSHRLGQGWSAALPAERDSARTLVVAFGAPGYAEAPQALDELAAAFPKSAIVGCSSAGEIHDHLVADGTLVVAIAQFERTDLAVASTPDRITPPIRRPPARASEASSPRARPKSGPGAFPKGSPSTAPTSCADSPNALPRDTMIVGGLAADGDRFARTWVLVDGKPASGHVAPSR